MRSIKGTITGGVKDFGRRMTRFREVFTKATGEELYPGTLNVKINQVVPIREDFRILGAEIGEPEQDLLFERCLISGNKGYRIRPYHLLTGRGGHGDSILEIACAKQLAGVTLGIEVEVTFFRDIT